MRWLALVFVVLILALQYPMWLGKGSWLQVRELDRQLSIQREANARLKARNDRLDADVGDLKAGYEAIEERARSELGMVRQDEVFFQLQNKTGAAAGAADSKEGRGAGKGDAAAKAEAPPSASAGVISPVSAPAGAHALSPPATTGAAAASGPWPGNAGARESVANRE